MIFALDYPTLEAAQQGAQQVRGQVGTVKVGLELFTRYGPEAIALGRRAGADVFLDLKLHDIPATVGRAVRSLTSHGEAVRYLTVHASGGSAMLREAVEQATAASHPLTVVAVTVLTSLDREDLQALGVERSPQDQAIRLAELGWTAGVRAFVCSPAEAAALRHALGAEARIITPGVRPPGAGHQDQKRVMTPARAIGSGADMLVVGRPIRDADDPGSAAGGIVADIASALDQPQK
ncbi:MAG: orotidine-5'-phosphate decarboxylase [Deltaproteobacteria bacterium]|nr:MAG: orotidine-5'-phosphate decarboxylase [Deltaproteobacteria bacterium]